jgi:hypothetical protein
MAETKSLYSFFVIALSKFGLEEKSLKGIWLTLFLLLLGI